MEASNLIGYNGNFATRLRELMKNAKVTQQDLAAAVGTTRQAISQYADGSVQPNIEKLYKISEFFHVSADYLLGLSDTQSCDIQIREISKFTGLTERSIENLHYETKEICELGHSDMPQEALKNWHSYNGTNKELHSFYPRFHTINLLLSDLKTGAYGDTIIDRLGEILAFRTEVKNSKPSENTFYGLFKAMRTKDDLWNYDTDKSPSYHLDHNEILDVLLLELQIAIKRYKDENDKDSKQ